MKSWIFVMNGTTDDFLKRIHGSKWPIYSKTHHRHDLSVGDVVVFYLAGKPNKKLLGTAKISTGLKKDAGIDFTVGISELEIWKKPKPIKELIMSLGFIKNKDNWGMSFQGGVIPLPSEDYQKIVNSR